MLKQPLIAALKDLAPLARPHPSLEYLTPESGRYRQIDNQEVDASPEVENLAAILRNDPVLQESLKTPVYKLLLIPAREVLTILG